MKKNSAWKLALILILVTASAGVYAIHFLIFHDVHHIFLYLIGDIAFLFLDVLLVILVIERLLSRQEKKIAKKKLHMLVGTFYSEVGLELFRKFAPFLENASELEGRLAVLGLLLPPAVAVGLVAEDTAVVVVHPHQAITVEGRDRTAGTVDRDEVMVDAEAVALGVAVGE